MCACLVVSDSFTTPWTVAHQASLSMGFSSQEYWNGLPFSSPGDLPSPGIKLTSPVSPALAGRFFTTEPLGKRTILSTLMKKWSSNVWVVALFFLIIGDTVALDCNLNHCYSLYVLFKFQVLCLKNEQCLLSSASYLITAFPLASGHPGLEIKILYYILCTVLYSKVHKSTATCGGWVHVTMFARHVN